MKNGRFLLVAGMLTLSVGMMAQTEGELLNLLPDGVEANINPERKQDKAKNLVVAGSPEKDYKAFFAAADAEHGEELWVTDGTPEGTHMVKDIVPGTAGSNPSHLGRLNDKVLFSAYTDETGQELWVSDGTEDGTHLVMDINWERYGEGQPGYEEGWTRNSAIDELKNYKNEKLFFRAWTPDFGQEPWASDGLDVNAVNGPGSDGTEHTYTRTFIAFVNR